MESKKILEKNPGKVALVIEKSLADNILPDLEQTK
jgi:hypothetical protein